MAFRTTETKSKERANYFKEYLIIFKKNSLFNIIFYHINYGVIQGFPALRKAVTTRVKKYDIERFATGRFWPFTWKTSSVGKDKVYMRILEIENYDHCCFCNHDSTHFSIFKSQRQRSLRLLFEDCRFIYFHSFMKSAFLSCEGLFSLYDKQNNTWLLVDIEFLFSCSTRHLTRSLRSLVSYRVKHSKRNSISTCAPILFFISLLGILNIPKN